MDSIESIFSVTKSLCLLFAVAAISLFTVGGCNGSGSGSQSHVDAILLGDHQQQVTQELEYALNLGQYDGELNNVLFHCVDIDKLTDEEKGIIKDAYDNNFVVVAYDTDDTCVHELLANVLKVPHIEFAAEQPGTDQQGVHSIVFVEQHHGHLWTGETVFDTTDPQMVSEEQNPTPIPEGGKNADTNIVPPSDKNAPQFGTYEPDSVHILDWIVNYDAREKRLEEIGTLTQIDSQSVGNTLSKTQGSTQANEETNRISQLSGTLGSQAPDYINTFTYTARPPSDTNDYQDNSINGSYQMTTYIWVLTVNNGGNANSYVMVDQDFNLQSANLYARNGKRDKGWQLWVFKNSNVLTNSGGTVLPTSDAFLLDNTPQSVDAKTETHSSSVSTSLSGGFRGLQLTGSGTVSWGSSTTIQKANVGIKNLSLSVSGNDATWEYTARKPAAEDSSACTWNSLSGPAELARTNFQPTQAYIYRLDSKYAGKTIQLKSTWYVTLLRSYLDKCKKSAFGCRDCSRLTRVFTDNMSAGAFPSAKFKVAFTLPDIPPAM